MEVDLLALPSDPVGNRIAAQVMLEQFERHDQRQQPLAVVFDEAQELRLTKGRPCPRWRGGSLGSPSGAGPFGRSHAWPRPIRLQPITPWPSMSMTPYSVVNSSQSPLPESAMRQPMKPTPEWLVDTCETPVGFQLGDPQVSIPMTNQELWLAS
jgi:hypothetical protein